MSAVANELPGMEAEEHNKPELSVINLVSTPLEFKCELNGPFNQPNMT